MPADSTIRGIRDSVLFIEQNTNTTLDIFLGSVSTMELTWFGSNYALASIFTTPTEQGELSNIVKIADPKGFFERHYLSPRAQSQEQMNSYMRGYEWYLAERYTNVTKILFLALWYSSIYPMGFFLCALALYINYYVERFCLMRSWRRLPR